MKRLSKCLYHGMNFWLIILALQIAVTIFAFARESGSDIRFDGEKLEFRS